MFNKLSLVFGKYNGNEYYNVKNRLRLATKKIIKNVLKGKVIAFTGKPSEMTKKHFMNLVESYGGITTKDFNYRIDIFVVFNNPVKSKLELLERIKEHKDILVLNEKEFMELITND